MERLQEILKKLIFPKIIWRVLLILIGFGGIIAAFWTSQTGVFMYLAEFLSAYALIVTVAWIVVLYIELYPKFKNRLYEYEIVNRYTADHYFRVFVGLCLSLTINLAFAGLKLGMAIQQSSVWLGAIAGYYTQLCVIRIFLTKQLLDAGKEREKGQEWKAYRITAFLLLLTNLALGVIVTQIVREGRSYNYPGYVIYAAAAYTFYLMGNSIYNFIRYNKFDSPLLSAVKTVNLTTALVSVFTLQSAMISAFDEKGKQTVYLNVITGIIVCVLVLVMAGFMLLRAGKTLKG